MKCPAGALTDGFKTSRRRPAQTYYLDRLLANALMTQAFAAKVVPLDSDGVVFATKDCFGDASKREQTR